MKVKYFTKFSDHVPLNLKLNRRQSFLPKYIGRRFDQAPRMFQWAYNSSEKNQTALNDVDIPIELDDLHCYETHEIKMTNSEI